MSGLAKILFQVLYYNKRQDHKSVHQLLKSFFVKLTINTQRQKSTKPPNRADIKNAELQSFQNLLAQSLISNMVETDKFFQFENEGLE